LVVAKGRDRLVLSKRATQKTDMEERVNLNKLHEGEVKKQYQVTITNKSAALENLKDNVNITRAWDNIREKIEILSQESLRYCESKYHTTWFDEECSNWLIKGSRLYYSDCKTQVKRSEVKIT
jgi:hypothetical protein